jgi:hypothetical protein
MILSRNNLYDLCFILMTLEESYTAFILSDSTNIIQVLHAVGIVMWVVPAEILGCFLSSRKVLLTILILELVTTLTNIILLSIGASFILAFPCCVLTILSTALLWQAAQRDEVAENKYFRIFSYVEIAVSTVCTAAFCAQSWASVSSLGQKYMAIMYPAILVVSKCVVIYHRSRKTKWFGQYRQLMLVGVMSVGITMAAAASGLGSDTFFLLTMLVIGIANALLYGCTTCVLDLMSFSKKCSSCESCCQGYVDGCCMSDSRAEFLYGEQLMDSEAGERIETKKLKPGGLCMFV